MDDLLKDSWTNTNDPISKQIKQRLIKAGKKFYCNDNISEYIKNGELEKLQAEVQEKIQGVLESLVIDKIEELVRALRKHIVRTDIE